MPFDQSFMLHDPSGDFVPLFKTHFTGQAEVNTHEHARERVFLGCIGNAMKCPRLDVRKWK